MSFIIKFVPSLLGVLSGIFIWERFLSNKRIEDLEKKLVDNIYNQELQSIKIESLQKQLNYLKINKSWP